MKLTARSVWSWKKVHCCFPRNTQLNCFYIYTIYIYLKYIYIYNIVLGRTNYMKPADCILMTYSKCIYIVDTLEHTCHLTLRSKRGAAKHTGCCKAHGVLQTTWSAAKHKGCCKAQGVLQGTRGDVFILYIYIYIYICLFWMELFPLPAPYIISTQDRDARYFS